MPNGSVNHGDVVENLKKARYCAARMRAAANNAAVSGIDLSNANFASIWDHMGLAIEQLSDAIDVLARRVGPPSPPKPEPNK